MKLSAVNMGVGLVAAAGALLGQGTPIDVQRSTITIHVGKAGMLSAAGHEHWINAPIASGSIVESPEPQVEFTVDAARMVVQPDAKVDASTQAQIQKDMQQMTLESGQFPHITFRSTKVEKVAEGQWRVSGDLVLHGVTRTISLAVKRSGPSYNARTVLKQTDFGIKPITVGGGMIKVKNEVELDFQIFPNAQK